MKRSIKKYLNNTKVNPYKLSSNQQEILDRQINQDNRLYIEAEYIYKDFKKKYDL
ncbi:hypothetical protein PQ462_15070 [Flavobacterium sp. KACC 22758]|jgi:Fe2+ or Zn2+ uptake regulation protein|uniref:hypothetical protein n=1 Tax=Flavobacterium sp. KACC 22758 TaxID=3025667 RepID=UPI00236527EA|nr:hypothetical protein [Flavobacterium sp. KACC 22758]WDF58038.1 hypothetical protein PQ462_15070 [Flavobacterium sp. KACC 22758]